MSKIEQVWHGVHSDFKLTIDGRRCVLVCKAGATVPAFLDAMSDDELSAFLPTHR